MFKKSTYKCSKCGATGIKLWRSVVGIYPLVCAECAETRQAQRKYIETALHTSKNGNWIGQSNGKPSPDSNWKVNDDGFIEVPHGEDPSSPLMTDKLLLKGLGMVIPAIPVEGYEKKFWAYGEAPEEAFKKWKNLPTRK